jgi:hypothetical protein
MFIFDGVIGGGGQIGKVEHTKGKGGERVVDILMFQDGSPRLCYLRNVSFCSRWGKL